MDSPAEAVAGAKALLEVDPNEKLKPLHVIVLIVTLLHAVGIALWALVFLSSSKRASLITHHIYEMCTHFSDADHPCACSNNCVFLSHS